MQPTHSIADAVAADRAAREGFLAELARVPSDNPPGDCAPAAERAAILLHEAQHLWGAGEDAALERVWRTKQRLGWTAAEYSQSKVWRNTREWTAAGVPALFQCGPDRHADCVR